MTTNSPIAPIASGCSQIAYVVKDIQASQKFFNEHLGVPRFYLFENVQFEDLTYQGQPANFRIHLALAYAGEIQLELIEHLEGESIFQDFLQQKGEGLHHLGFLVDDYDQTVGDLTTHGYPLIQSGRAGSNPGTRFALFDTETPIGSIIEILALDEDMKNLFARIKQGDF